MATKSKPTGTGASALRRRAELSIPRRQPEAPDATTESAWRQSVHELEVHQIELEMQNEELRVTRQRLEDARDHYAAFYDFAPVGFVTLDERGFIRAINLTAATMLATPRARLLGQAFHAFVAAPQLAEFLQHLRRRSVGESRIESELRLVRPGHGELPVLMQSVLVGGEEESSLGCRATLTDLSALRRAEQALDESEARLQISAQAANIGFWDWDLITDEVHFSPEWKSQLGYTDHEISNRFDEWQSRVHPDEIAWALERIHAFLADPHGRYDVEFRLRHKDGTYRWINAQGGLLRDAAGVPVRMLGCHIDITVRKRGEEALAESKKRLAGIVESAMDAIVSIDPRQRIVLFNAAAESMFQLPVSDALGRPLERIIPKRFLASLPAQMRRLGKKSAAGGAAAWAGAVSGLRADGTEFPIEASLSQIRIGGEKLLTVIMRDITERRRLEREVLEIIEGEQRRIGVELHDGLGQQLTAINLMCSLLKQKLSAQPELERQVEGIGELLQAAIREARDLSHGLAPLQLEYIGLVQALEDLAHTTTATGRAVCVLECPRGMEEIAAPVAAQLYRIAQEAVSNALKHGAPGRIELALHRDRRALSLRISDNGTGFPKGRRIRRGMGLEVLKYRANVLGGTLRVQSKPGRGVVVSCTVPLPES